ncbi:DUF1826 domain-containing protein [Parasphingopyxis sp.]|uniref:DUF1826 domain-containing protein n=1 Tax=Parasphingopyxis sp. TaxID=1920299 RepID=UPI00262DD3D3|nr:DUF1826 domain-containing protein [Parasphingopyxis sp.]
MTRICTDTIVDWRHIQDPACSLAIEDRPVPISRQTIDTMLGHGAFYRIADGTLAAIEAEFADLPSDLRADILHLGGRFRDLMQVETIRVRLEVVTTNACQKVHADFTDVRLITTYAGPGTDYAADDDPGCCLERMPAGWIGLFKGRRFGPGHAPRLHRSPPIEGMGEDRLVLVIDTPIFASDPLT